MLNNRVCVRPTILQTRELTRFPEASSKARVKTIGRQFARAIGVVKLAERGKPGFGRVTISFPNGQGA